MSTAPGAVSAYPRVRGLPDLGRCRIFGVLNVTPDSFSDGGQWLEPDDAIGRGHELAALGADIVDVGGESTRPGAPRVPVEEEMRRVLPVVTALAADGVAVSIDTTRAVVAEAAVSAGATVVNDVSGGLADTAMVPFVAGAEVPYVVMHSRGRSADMNARAHYADVVAEVREHLRRRLDAVVAAGVDAERVILDPGLGFSKNADHNWEILRHLDRIIDIGRPVLVGASRKRFLGHLLEGPGGEPRAALERDDASLAVDVLVAAAGAWAVRTHRVREHVDAMRVVERWGRDG